MTGKIYTSTFKDGTKNQGDAQKLTRLYWALGCHEEDQTKRQLYFNYAEHWGKQRYGEN